MSGYESGRFKPGDKLPTGETFLGETGDGTPLWADPVGSERRPESPKETTGSPPARPEDVNTQPAHEPRIPDDAVLHIYWCPHCEKQIEKAWHTARRGPALIPQLDEEHYGIRVRVVPALAAASPTTEET